LRPASRAAASLRKAPSWMLQRSDAGDRRETRGEADRGARHPRRFCVPPGGAGRRDGERRRRAAGGPHRADAKLGKAAVEQTFHSGVARGGRAPAQDHADETMSAANRRGREVEPGGVDVAGFDPVGAGIIPEQRIVAEDRPAAKIEFLRRKITVFAREVVIEGESELRFIARGRHLIGIRQARSIAVMGAGHPELARLGIHPCGKGRLASGQALGQNHRGVVGRAGDDAEDQALDAHAVCGTQSELRRRPARRPGGNRKRLVEAQPAGVERLKCQIKGHHLGERGRVGERIGIRLAEQLAGFRIDDDRRLDRRAVAGGGRMAQPMPRGVCRSRCQCRRPEKDDREAASPPLCRHRADPPNFPTGPAAGSPAAGKSRQRYGTVWRSVHGFGPTQGGMSRFRANRREKTRGTPAPGPSRHAPLRESVVGGRRGALFADFGIFCARRRAPAPGLSFCSAQERLFFHVLRLFLGFCNAT
jgi:hypothetical protein